MCPLRPVKVCTEPQPGGRACQVPGVPQPVLQHLPHFPSRAAPTLELCVLLWGSAMTVPTAHAALHDELCGPGQAVGARTQRVNTSALFSSPLGALLRVPAWRALLRDPQAPRPALLPLSCAASAPRRRTAPARIGGRDAGRDRGQDRELERRWA